MAYERPLNSVLKRHPEEAKGKAETLPLAFGKPMLLGVGSGKCAIIAALGPKPE